MPERTRYLLAYDIRDPSRLRRVHQTARQFGYALQYSVFICDLEPASLVALREQLRTTIHHREDSVSIFALGPADGRQAKQVIQLGVEASLPNTDREAVW